MDKDHEIGSLRAEVTTLSRKMSALEEELVRLASQASSVQIGLANLTDDVSILDSAIQRLNPKS
jgi:chromosome segregation ATPase